MVKFNQALAELRSLYQLYDSEVRNQDYLEQQFDLLNLREKENTRNIKLYLERMQQ